METRREKIKRIEESIYSRSAIFIENKITIFLGAIAVLLWFCIFINYRISGESKTKLISEEKLLKVVFFDVGQGDSALVCTPNNKYVLIDAGSWAGATISEGESGELVTETDSGKDIILPYLRKNNITELEGIIISHPHNDHFGGLLSKALIEKTKDYFDYFFYQDFLKNFLIDLTKEKKEFLSILFEIPVNWFIDSGLQIKVPEYGLLRTLVEIKKIKYIIAKPGETIDFGDPDIKVELLGPLGSYMLDTISGVNNSSLVFKVTYKDVSILFTGDIEIPAELDLLDLKNTLKSTILKMPHHGSHTSSSIPFLEYVKPEVAIISCGRGNPFGHPHSETISKLEQYKIKYYRTDRDGNIILKTDGKNYTIETIEMSEKTTFTSKE